MKSNEIINKLLLSLFGIIFITYGYFQYIMMKLFFIYLILKTLKFLQCENGKRGCREKSNILLEMWSIFGIYYLMDSTIGYILMYLPFSSLYYVTNILLFGWIIRNKNNVRIIYKKCITHNYSLYNTELANTLNYIEKINYNITIKINNITKYMLDNAQNIMIDYIFFINFIDYYKNDNLQNMKINKNNKINNKINNKTNKVYIKDK